MLKKSLLYCLILMSLLLSNLFLFDAVSAQERKLEVDYPEIGGFKPETVATGLPPYINYIFRFAVAIIGFIILGALVYSGVSYFFSFGNPQKLIDAREGIIAAFVGGVILLAAVLIFNTINPELTILTPQKIDPLSQIIGEGIYVCNYKVDEDELKAALNDYILEGEIPKDKEELSKKIEKNIQGKNKLANIIVNKNNPAERCFRYTISTNFRNFVVTNNNTIFAIPRIDQEREGEKEKWVPKYEWGIILHEKENFRGRCDYYPKRTTDGKIYKIYRQDSKDAYLWGITGYKPYLFFPSAASITIFKKPSEEPHPSAKGIIFYPCSNYMGWDPESPFCPPSLRFEYQSESIKPLPTADFLRVPHPNPLSNDEERHPWPANAQESAQITNSFKKVIANTLSLQVDPKNTYFAIFFDGARAGGRKPSFKGECLIIKSNVNEFLALVAPTPFQECWRAGDDYLGGACGRQWWTVGLWNRECVPCFSSMIIIKGWVL